MQVAIESKVYPPDPEREQLVLERLNDKFPELGINVAEECKILRHARASLNAGNN